METCYARRTRVSCLTWPASPAASASSETRSVWLIRWVPLVCVLVISRGQWLDGNDFGRNNQIEQLPIVMALMNEGFLERDFFINGLVEDGPRYYYARLLALAGQVMPLPVLFFVLTVAANAATLMITFRTTWRLFEIPQRVQTPHWSCPSRCRTLYVWLRPVFF